MGLPEQAIHCIELALGVLILVLIKIVIGRQLIRILMRAANRLSSPLGAGDCWS